MSRRRFGSEKYVIHISQNTQTTDRVSDIGEQVLDDQVVLGKFVCN